MKIENDYPPELRIKNEIESDNAEDEEDNVPSYEYIYIMIIPEKKIK